MSLPIFSSFLPCILNCRVILLIHKSAKMFLSFSLLTPSLNYFHSKTNSVDFYRFKNYMQWFSFLVTIRWPFENRLIWSSLAAISELRLCKTLTTILHQQTFQRRWWWYFQKNMIGLEIESFLQTNSTDLLDAWLLVFHHCTHKHIGFFDWHSKGQTTFFQIKIYWLHSNKIVFYHRQSHFWCFKIGSSFYTFMSSKFTFWLTKFGGHSLDVVAVYIVL